MNLSDGDDEIKRKVADRMIREKRIRDQRRQRRKQTSATSKFGNGNAMCKEEHEESLNCIENYGRGSPICERSFEIYKECLKTQRKLRLARNSAVNR